MVVKIKSFLIFGFGGLLFSALMITLFLGFYSATKNTFSLLTDKANSLIDSTTLNVEQELKLVERQAKWIVTAFRNKAISLTDTENLETFLIGGIGTTPDVDAIFIATPSGIAYRVRQSTRKLDIADISRRKGAMEAVEYARTRSGPMWEEPIWLEEISDTAINLRTPLIVDNEYIGVLVQIKSISGLSKTLSLNSSHMGGHVPFVLYDEDYVLAHPSLASKSLGRSEKTPLTALVDFDDRVIANLDDLLIYDDTTRYSIGDVISGELEVDGETYFVLFKELEGYADKPITVGSYFRMDYIDNEINLLFSSMAVAIIVMLVSVFVALWLSRKISKPVDELQKAVQAVNRESYDEVIDLKKGLLFEFNEASAAFNSMVKGLKEKKVIRELFGRVVPAAVAEQMLNSPEGLKPFKTTATVLFSDLAKFTSISEKLQPEEIVEMLNAYFTVMTDIIRAHGGIVTQFQGDAVLAVFNVPVEDSDHAHNAIKAAHEMKQAMEKMTISGHDLRCRIGVNTGLLVAGNVGAEKRMNYTVHGDAVNLAARLEQLNKEYGTTVLISDSTVKMANSEGVKSLGFVTVRGKSQPVEIYTFVD